MELSDTVSNTGVVDVCGSVIGSRQYLSGAMVRHGVTGGNMTIVGTYEVRVGRMVT